MSKKEQIIRLHEEGLSTNDIAFMTGATERYIRKVTSNGKNLTIPNYIKAWKQGARSQADFMEVFGVSRMTIYRFTRDNNIGEIIEAFEKAYSTLIPIKDELRSFLTLIEKPSKYDKAMSNNFHHIRSILEKLQTL